MTVQPKGNETCECQLPMYDGLHCMRCHKTVESILGVNITEEDIEKAIEDADNA